MRTFLILLAMSGAAYAHLVPADVDSPDLAYLRDEKKDDLAVGVAQYCAGLSIPVDICVSRIGKTTIAAESATECAKEVGWAPDFDATAADMKVAGTTAEGKKLMIFHNYYAYDKDYGMHRHEWGTGARDMAGTEYALYKVEALKRAWSGSSSSTSMGADLQGKYAGDASVKLPGAQAGSSLEVKGGGEVKTTQEQKGPPPEKIQEEWDRGYAIGKENPWNTAVTPDVLCTRSNGHDSCNGGPDPSTAPKAPEPPQTVAPAPEPPKSDWPNAYPMSKETSWEQPKGLSPLESCLQEKINKKKEQELTTKTTQEDDAASKESLKKQAEESLKMGVCMPAWYGEDYCREFNAQKNMVIQPIDDSVVPMNNPSSDDFGLVADYQPEDSTVAPELPTEPDPSKAPVHPWCNDPRATYEEKVKLRCPGYEAPIWGEPTEEDCRRMSDIDKLAYGCPEE